MSLSELVPRECRGWVTENKDDLFTREGIYKYMDGAGELYREYDYRELFVRKFQRPGAPPITVEVFDMGSAANAFGVFAHTRDGPPAGVGQDSEYRAGLLCFWKGRFFVCIRTEPETPSSKEAVLEMGRKIAGAIQEEGDRPELLTALPTEDLIPENVRYFRKHTCLNYHYFLSDENILNLGAETEAVLAPYRAQEARTYLLLVRYPTPSAAKAALDSFLRAYLPEAKDVGLARTENGRWAGAKLLGQRIAIVLDARTRKAAESLLNSVGG